MGTIVYDGARYELPGVTVRTGPSPGSLKRRSRVTSIVLHSTDGRAREVSDDAHVADDALKQAQYQARKNLERIERGEAPLGVPLWVGTDGSVVQTFDPARWWGWSQQAASARGIPIETGSYAGKQTPEAIASTVALVELLSSVTGLARTIPADPGRARWNGRADPPAGLGVWGHSDVWNGKPAGDPGAAVWRALREAGYTPAPEDPMPRPNDPRSGGSSKPAAWIDVGRDPRPEEAFLLTAFLDLVGDERLEAGGTAVAYSIRDAMLGDARELLRQVRRTIPDAAGIYLFTGPSA